MIPSNLVKPCVRRLRAYEAKEIPCRVKLDANESPYELWSAGDNKLGRILRRVPLNRYPDPAGTKLKEILALRHGVRADRLLLGNGSDELISMLVTTFGGPVLYPVPTFSMYGIISRGLGEKTVEVKLERSFDLNLDRMESAIRKSRAKVVFLSSPNNPTGNAFSSNRIQRIIETTPGIVVVDEAYHPFSSTPSFITRLKRHPNLVVLQTLSKIGLAALRLGFMVASRDIVNEVNKVRLPFNVNTLSQMIAVEALEERDTLKEAIGRIVQERDRMMRMMADIPGLRVVPSDANFILFRVPDASRVYRGLLQEGILVRNLEPAIPGGLRVTVGTRRENTAFLHAIRKVRL